MIDLSVIVATWKRPQLLTLCLEQYRQQRHTLNTEIIVVSDGLDPRARAVADYYSARYIELFENHNDWGAAANDAGIAAAFGEYVCLWNDDNLYYPHNLATLHAAAMGFDIGVCQTLHWQSEHPRVIPPPNFKEFAWGSVDAMCVCVRRGLAASEPWVAAPTVYECDIRWLARLMQHSPTLNFSPVVVGMHL